MYINLFNSRYKNIVIYNKGISFINNDQVFGCVDVIMVDMIFGCNEFEFYFVGFFIILVKDGMFFFVLYQYLNLNVILYLCVNMFQVLI